MITKLGLERFKSFRNAELDIGPFTTLVGTNASGKSNVRDALRFLHGISRGYSLAEIIGEKWVEGGVLQWSGIRGGSREAAMGGSGTFAVSAEVALTFELGDPITMGGPVVYRIEVDPAPALGARVVKESLYQDGTMLFDSHPGHEPPHQADMEHVSVRLRPGGDYRKLPVKTLIASRPVISQISERIAGRRDSGAKLIRSAVQHVIAALGSMRFLDLAPDAMRKPSLPGQIVLGDRGENLSSVLQAICADRAQKRSLLAWIQAVAPIDAADLEFPEDTSGRILLHLVDSAGCRISATSASDGTLRFLAILAALRGPEPAGLYFVEELENGIHPTRVRLLLQLIEKTTAAGRTQVVATTHSPNLLGLISPASQGHASVVYRAEEETESRIRSILELPDARRVVGNRGLAALHAAGWLENAASFDDAGEDEEAVA